MLYKHTNMPESAALNPTVDRSRMTSSRTALFETAPCSPLMFDTEPIGMVLKSTMEQSHTEFNPFASHAKQQMALCTVSV